MRKISLTLFTFVGITLLAWTASLTSCGKNARNVFISKVDILGFRNNAPNNPISDNDTVSYANFSLQVQFQLNIFTAQIKNAFLNEALALKIPEPRLILLDTIKNIKVFTVNNYNAQYPAGAEITSMCKFRRNSYDTTGIELENLYTLINNSSSSTYSYNRMPFQISLKSQTTSAATAQRFRIEVRTGNNAFYTDTTLNYFIIP